MQTTLLSFTIRRQPPQSRTATPNTTSDTGFSRYLHHTPPTTKIRTVMPWNHHHLTAIPTGSNDIFQDRRQKNVLDTKLITTPKWWNIPFHATGHGQIEANRPHQQDPLVPYIQYLMSPTTPACQRNTQSRKRQVTSRRPRRLHNIERGLCPLLKQVV